MPPLCSQKLSVKRSAYIAKFESITDLNYFVVSSSNISDCIRELIILLHLYTQPLYYRPHGLMLGNPVLNIMHEEVGKETYISAIDEEILGEVM